MNYPWKISLAVALCSSAVAWAANPTSSTAVPQAAAQQIFVCKDGSKITAATSQGTCRGHQGIDTEATAKARTAPVAGAKKGAAAEPTKAPVASAEKNAKPGPAPGGGPGKVWANAASKVYHCHGDRHYGTTKVGSYMTEAEAKNQGMQPSRNKSCS